MREGLSWRWLALILLAFCFPLFVGLGATDLENDEAIYSYAVDSVLETGDWLSPRSSPRPDITFVEKPPLKFWIVAAPIRLGLLPHNEFGLRFWDAVFGSVAFVYVFLIGRRLGGPLSGAVAVLVLFAQHRLLFDHGLRSNNMEGALFLAYCGGVYHFIRYADEGTVRRGWHIAAVAGLFYLGFMTKFVAALFLPIVLGIAGFAVREWRSRLLSDRWRWAAAAAGVVAAIVPWFAYQHVVTEGGIWRVMFGEHVVTRFTAYADPEHVQPWYFYVAELFRQLQRSGATLLVAFGLPLLVLDSARRRLPAGLLVITWFAIPVLLISAGTSKLYHYIYPFLPPLALAAGYGTAWVVSRGGPALAAALSKRGLRIPAVRHGLAQDVLLLGAIAAAGLAVVTAAHGHVRLMYDGSTVFRNSSVVRPLLVSGLLAVLAGRVTGAAAATMVLAIALVVPLPLHGYVNNIGALTGERRPLRRLGDCLQDVDASRRAAGERIGGVFALDASDGGFLHQYFYYLRRAGGWQERTGKHDDEAISRALFARGEERPVVLESRFYSEYLQRHPPQAPLPQAVHVGRLVVVLPGPYNRCAAPRERP